MNTNDTPDDGWADLAKELGLESGERSRPAPAAPEPEPEPAEEFEDAPFGGEPEDSSDADAGDDEPDGDDEAETPGEPGEGSPKKRRRRRRRRKKKGPGEPGADGGPAVATADAEGDTGPDEEALPESETGWDDGGEAEEVGAVVGEEQVTPEAAREIVANWNVPSWEEIVAGLYRPDR